MSRVHVLGIGSPSGDDQAGWLTIDALLARGVRAGDGLVIEKLDRPGANLVSLLENASWVILIDAILIETMQGNGRVGQIQRFNRHDWPGFRHGLSSHGFGVLESLSLARELGCLPHRLDLFGIGVNSAAQGRAAGSEVEAAAQELAGLIADDLWHVPAA